jgi:DmsE family decaheme c-type cytochrome
LAPNYGILKVDLPQVPDAEFVNDDSLCATCHETYAKKFETNVHHAQKCESCHGPASRHLATRGQEPGLILSFKTMPPAERSEACLKCHEKPHEPGERWRTSAHAHKGVSCTDCHRGHYDIAPGTPSTEVAGLIERAAEVAASDHQATPANSTREASSSVSPHRALPAERAIKNGSLTDAELGQVLQRVSSEPFGLTARPRAARSSGAVVRAQEPSGPAQYSGKSNYMGAVAPQVCYKCHADMQDLEAIAHPHQVCGKNGFNCTTCHDTHGNIRMETRRDMCVECHQGTPTMAWHSSTHNLYDVACTDCHNPHPRAKVEEFVNVTHTSIDRPKRMPMSVDEPGACFKCHPKIFAAASMPSHHPIKEGKMTCSACHDGHGQNHGNLKDGATVNMVCYKCHAEKQGPFAYEHPPVTENCAICHEPHGTVANNLLRQPANFLCLRCHTGHRTSPRGPNHDGTPGGSLLGDVGTSPALQRAFFTDCTQCHHEIHGSDLPSPHVPHGFMR